MADDLPTPVQPDATQLPTPIDTPDTPQTIEAAGEGEAYRGLRRGEINLGAAYDTLAGQVGATMGASQYAQKKFSEAAEDTKEALSYKPRIASIGDVHSVADLMDFIASISGESAPSMLPALALTPFLGPVTGTTVGFAPGMVGEEIQRLRGDPDVMSKHTSGDILGMGTASGVTQAFMYGRLGAPGRAATGLRTVAKGIAAKTAAAAEEEAPSFVKEAGKAIVGQAAVQPAADITGQLGAQAMGTKKDVDLSQVPTEAATGAAFGAMLAPVAGLKAVGRGVAKTAGELRARLSPKGEPLTTGAEPPGAEGITDVEGLMKAYEEHEGNVKEQLKAAAATGDYPQFKDWEKDPAMQDQFEKQLVSDYQGLRNQKMAMETDVTMPPAAGFRGLLFGRHGETMNNAKKLMRGWLNDENTQLNEKGRKEANDMADSLLALPENERPTVIYHSDLGRTTETAQIVAKKLGIQAIPDPRLRPWHVGDLMGAESAKGNTTLTDYAKNKPNEPLPGGESANNFFDRQKKAFHDIMELNDENQRPMVVAHSRNHQFLRAYDPVTGQVDVKRFTDWHGKDALEPGDTSRLMWPTGKATEMRTQLDDVVHDYMLKQMPDDLKKGVSPENLMSLSGAVNRIAKDPSLLKTAGIGRFVERRLGPKAKDIIKFAMKTQLPVAERKGAVRALSEAFAKPADYESTVERIGNVLRTYMRPEYRNDPALRGTVLETMSKQLYDMVAGKTEIEKTSGMTKQEFDARMDEAFGTNKAMALAALDKIRGERTVSQRAYEGVQKEEGLAPEEQERPETGEPATGVPHPAFDPRQNEIYEDTPEGLEKMKNMREELLNEYGPKNVEVNIERLEDGRRMLKIEPAMHEGYSPEEWEKMREPKETNLSGIENGIITAKVEKDGKIRENKMNIIRMVHDAMRTQGQNVSRFTGVHYVADMFGRALSTLMNSEQFRGIKESFLNEKGQIEFPDNMRVAKLRGKWYTYGSIKSANWSRDPRLNELYGKLKGAKTADEQADIKADIQEHKIMQLAVRSRVDEMEKEAMDKVTNGLAEMKGELPADVQEKGPEPMDPSEMRDEQPTAYDNAMDVVDNAVTPMKDQLKQASTLLEKANKMLATKGRTPDEINQIQKKAAELSARKFHLENALRNVEREADRIMSGTPDMEDMPWDEPGVVDPGYIDTSKFGERAKEGPRYWDEQGQPLKYESWRKPDQWPASLRKAYDEYMAKQAKPEAETPAQAQIRHIKETGVLKSPGEIKAFQDAQAQIKQIKETGVLKSPEEIKAFQESQKKLSETPLGPKPMSADEEQAVRDYGEKVLGKDLMVKVVDSLKKGAGEFIKGIKGEELIKIHAYASDPTGVMYHEAAHAFFSRLMEQAPEAAKVLLRYADAPHLLPRLKELLKGKPEALKQLSDPEHRVVYAYQFWASGHEGLVKVGPETGSWFQKAKDFFRKLGEAWNGTLDTAAATERAGQFFDAFHRGEFADKNAVAKVIAEKFPESPMEKASKLDSKLGRFMNKFVFTGSGAVRDMKYPALTKVMDKYFGGIKPTEDTKDKGYLQLKENNINRFENRLKDILHGSSEGELKAIADDMRTDKEPTLEKAKQIKALLKDVFDYMKAKGVKVMVPDPQNKGKFIYKDLEEVKHYFPRVFNQEFLMTMEGRKKFIDLLKKYGRSDAEAEATASTAVRAHDELNYKDGEDPTIGMTHYNPNINPRTLGDIPDSELKPFLEDNVVGTMSQYIRRAVRRAEYSDHFGNRGEEIEAAVNEAKSAGLTPEQETIFRQTVSGMDGTLGADMSPQLRKLYSGMMTYQNVRLLPLQVLSSLIDPLGMMIRGGTLKDSMKAYGRALAGMHRFGGDVAHQMAKTTGSILDALDSSMMAEMANGNYMSPWAKNINQWFFRINGMERYNRIMRVTATEAAYDFIMRHATSPGADSERFLSELRLDSDYVKSKIGLDGRMDYNDERIRNAMNQWVDEAVLRPNPAFRSIMMNDPHWMLIAHLKQFTYQFQKVINERVLHEAKLGNYRPAMVLAGYVPVMMAADALRAGMMPNSPMAIQRQDWGPADYLWSGIQRTGMLGISQLGVDALQDPFHGQIPGASDLGPTVQQLLSFVQATGAQHGAMGKQIVRGIPGANIFYGSTLADVSPLTTD